MDLPVATIIKEMPDKGAVYVMPDKRRVFFIYNIGTGVRVASYGENKDGLYTYITYLTEEEFATATPLLPAEFPLSADKYIIGEFRWFHLRDNRSVRAFGWDRQAVLVEDNTGSTASVYLVKPSDLFFESVLDKAKPFT